MFLDIHAHLYRYPYPVGYEADSNRFRMLFLTESELIAIHDRLQIGRAVLLPLVSSEVYLPQSVGEIIEICRQSNGRFIPFCNVDPRVLTNTSDAPLGCLLDFFKRQGCKGVGEVLPNMAFRDLKLQNLFHVCEQMELPLLFDLSGQCDTSYGLYDDAGLPQLEWCLERYPDLIFIGHGPAFWAELGILKQYEDRFGYPSGPIIDEGAVPRLMRNHQNLWVDLSARSGSNAMQRDLGYALQFIKEFSDRILFGTDICSADNTDFVLIDYLNSLLEDNFIAREVFEKITHTNAEILLQLDPEPA